MQNTNQHINNESIYDGCINCFNEIFIVVGANRRLLYFNDEFVQSDIFIKNSNFQNQSIDQIISPFYLDWFSKLIDFSSKEKKELVDVLPTANGLRINISAFITPILDENNQLVAFSIILKNDSCQNTREIQKILNKIPKDFIDKSLVLVDAQKNKMPIIFVNDTFVKTTGYSIAEIIGKNCKFLQGEDTNKSEIKVLKQAIKNKTSCRVVLKNYKKDGSFFWNELYISPIFDENGVNTHFFGIQNDISNYKLLDDFVKKQTEFINQVGNLANLGGWEFIKETQQIICSDEVKHIFEDDKMEKQLSLNKWMTYFSNGARLKFKDALKLLYEKNLKLDLELPFISKMGTVKWLKINANSVVNSFQEVTFYGTIQDITNSHNQEEELMSLNNELTQYKIALDQTASIYIIDSNEKIIHANDFLCRTSKYKKEELIGTNHSILYSDFHTKGCFLEVWNSIKGGQSWRGEVKYKSKNSTYFWSDTSIVPILFVKRKPSHFLCIQYDITKRKNQEFFIQHALDEKEILINEIHHRVKNNLQIVSSLMNIQKASLNNDQLNTLYAEMQNRILSISYIHDTIYQTKNYSFINANIYINSILTNLKSSTLDKNIYLNSQIGEGIELGISAATYCGIIINEAVSNSIKHAFKEKLQKNKSIHIVLQKNKKKKSCYTLFISDNGSGIVEPEKINAHKKIGFELMEGLVTQMDGLFSYKNNGGLEINIEFCDNKKS